VENPIYQEDDLNEDGSFKNLIPEMDFIGPSNALFE
jgi:hypothetical protein